MISILGVEGSPWLKPATPAKPPLGGRCKARTGADGKTIVLAAIRGRTAELEQRNETGRGQGPPRPRSAVVASGHAWLVGT